MTAPLSKSESFKRAASLWASGVTVVSARTADGMHGVTVSAFSSLSLDPHMVLVCLAHNSRVLPLVRESGAFAVSVLADDQEALAMALSRSSRSVGEGMDGLTTPGKATGAPIIVGCISYFECTLRDEIIGGDHAILLGHVEDAGPGGGGAPLVYFNRQFRQLVEPHTSKAQRSRYSEGIGGRAFRIDREVPFVFATIARTWNLTKSSWSVLRPDKELILFPIAMAISVIAILAVFAGIGAATGSLDRIDAMMSDQAAGTKTESATVVDIVLLVAMAVSAYFAAIFFNAGLVAAALERLRGGDPTFSSGIRAVLPHVHNILGWAIISASVGLILRLLSQKADNMIARMAIGMIGGVWAYVTFFVVPILVVKGYGPIESIKASAGLFKRTWGEQVASNVGFGILSFIGFLIALAPAALLFAVSPIAGIGVGVLLMVLVLGIVAALEGIFKAALFEYAAEGAVGSGFTRADLAGSYRPR